MIIYAGNRRSAKTTKAIELAYSTDSLLIVANDTSVKATFDQSVAMKCPISVVSANSYFKSDEFNRHRRYGGLETRNVIIDDLDIILNKLFGCNVVMATTKGCNADINIRNSDKEIDKFYKLNNMHRK